MLEIRKEIFVFMFMMNILLTILCVTFLCKFESSHSYCYLDFDDNLGVSTICRHNQCDKGGLAILVKQFIDVHKYTVDKE